MGYFNSDDAIFCALGGPLTQRAEDVVFSYVNPTGKAWFGDDLEGISLFDLLLLILDNKERAEKSFDKIFSVGSLVVDGRLSGRDVRFHSMINRSDKHIQGAIMDITESRLAKTGFEYTAGALARASEVNDEDTGSHIIRINRYSAIMAVYLGQTEEFIESIGLLAQLHDVGKVHIDPRILKKPGRLTDEEFAAMRRHAPLGAKIIGDHTRLQMAREIANFHHEKWDGTGYPEGRKGEEIPLSARIVAVVDTFDALVTRRTYKPAFSYERALEIMSEGDGRTNPERDFAPDVLGLFLENYEVFESIHKELND